MPTYDNLQWPPPDNWQDFETLCCNLWTRIWNDPSTQRNGRQGQAQSGVDIYGRPDKGQNWAGVQCKLKNELNSGTLSEAEIREEVKKATTFNPPLTEYIIATTITRDARLQQIARQITEEQLAKNSFPVAIWFWEDIKEKGFGRFSDLVPLSYPQAFAIEVTGSDRAGQRLTPELETVVTLYLQRCFREENLAPQEAGEGDDKSPPLDRVFIDLEVGNWILPPLNSDNPPGDRPASLGIIGFNGPKTAIAALLNEQLCSKLLLIGGPGQGKSTLCQLLAQMQRAKLLNKPFAFQEQIEVPRLPFRIILKFFAQWLSEVSSRSGLENYLAEKLPTYNDGQKVQAKDIFQILRYKSCLLILDGLDEVIEPHLQQRMLSNVADFLERATTLKADLRIVACSRPLLYQDQLLELEQFGRVALLHLNTEKVSEYARNWIATQIADEDEKKRVLGIFQNYQHNPKFQALLGTPLQVTIILRIIKDRGTPPSQREALFEEYWRTIFNREKSKSISNNVLVGSSESRLFKLHCFLGYILHSQAAEQKVDARLSEKEFRHYVKAFLRQEDAVSSDKALERQIEQLVTETGERIVLISKPTLDTFGFEPRSFQEFFAAAYLVQKGGGVERQLPQWKAFAPYPHWRNVLLFAAGRIRRTLDSEEVRNIFLPLCKQLDTTELSRITRPGAWFALEIAADGAFEESRNLQKSVLDYGLDVLNTGLTFDQQQRLRILLNNLTYSDRQDMLRPILETKLNSLASSCILPILELYCRFCSHSQTFDKELIKQKLELLLETSLQDSPVSLRHFLELAITYQLEVEWVAKQFRTFWPQCQNYLLDWWIKDGYFDHWSDTEDSQQTYLEQVLVALMPSAEQVEELAILLMQPETEDGIDFDEDYKVLLNSTAGIKEVRPVDYLLALLRCRHILLATIEGTEKSRYVDTIELGGFGYIDFVNRKVSSVEISGYTTKQIKHLLKRRDLGLELLALLWIIFWNIAEPEEASLNDFSEDLARIAQRKEVWWGFVLQLEQNVKRWPLFKLLAERYPTHPELVEVLNPFLSATAQEQIGLQIFKALHEGVAQMDEEQRLALVKCLKRKDETALAASLVKLKELAQQLGVGIVELIGLWGEFHSKLNSAFTNVDELQAFLSKVETGQADIFSEEGWEFVWEVGNGPWPLENLLKRLPFLLEKLLAEPIPAGDEEQMELSLSLFFTLLEHKFGVERFIPILCRKLANFQRYKPRRWFFDKQIAQLSLSQLGVLEPFLIHHDDLIQFGAVKLWERVLTIKRSYSRPGKLSEPFTVGPEIAQALLQRELASSELERRLAGIALLSWTDSIIEDEMYQQLLRRGLRQSGDIQEDGAGKEEKEAWLNHLQTQTTALSTKCRPSWVKLLQQILHNPQMYSNRVLATAMECCVKLSGPTEATLSKEQEAQLALP